MPDEGSDLHIDLRGVLEHRFPAPFPRGQGEQWQVDQVASSIPWRAAVTERQAVTFARFAVMRAYEDARDALGKVRGQREAAARALHGAPDALDPVGAIADDPASPVAEFGRHLATRLGVAQLAGEPASAYVSRIRDAAKQSAGRTEAADVRAFICSLAIWWWVQTGRRPQARKASVPARADRRGGQAKRTSFVDFVTAAATDAGARGDISRALRTAMTSLAEGGSAPWFARPISVRKS